MIAAELTAVRQFRLAEMPIADPAPGEVQVRVASVGICGSDLHNYSEGKVGDTPCAFPMVIGHEPSGTVVKRGPGVSGWSAGDRAALEPAIYCYHCEYCLTGHHNVCAHIRFLSMPGDPGFFREYVNLPASNLLPIPVDMSLDLATVVEPLAVALHSMQFAALSPNETVAVIGAGPIGLLTIACVKLAGARRIIAVEPHAHRREMARHFGADAALDPSELGEIPRATGGAGVDCAIDCAAKAHTTNDAIRVTRSAGRVVITGIHAETHIPFEMSPMRRKELSVFNVRRSNHESGEALKMLAKHQNWFAPLVTHTRAIDRIGEAFEIAEGYLDGVGKMVVRP
jgi:L-iditol 2-dehydrogenase